MKTGREVDPDKDCCVACGEPIGRDRHFYRDDERPGEEYAERWLHYDCVFDPDTVCKLKEKKFLESQQQAKTV